jgi:mono/diheme cytochrome c family protein
MKTKLWVSLGAVVICGGALLFWASLPQRVDPAALPQHQADIKNGEVLFHAGGCISCHAPAKDAVANGQPLDPKLPSGGAPLKTPLGTLYPPNITADKTTGIGGWSDADFVNAMQYGVSPEGENLIPAFPYTSYRNMTVSDVLDIKAYLFSLPPVQVQNPDVGLPLAWFMRHGIGVWKRLALSSPPLQSATIDPAQSPSWNRGAYLVNGPGHCAECHTPRNILMISKADQAFMGGPHPSGKGKVPSLHGVIARGDFQDVDDLANGLKEGEDAGYDHLAYGGMGEVQKNISHLPDADIRAIAEYIASLK